LLRQGLSFLVIHGGAGIAIGELMKRLFLAFLIISLLASALVFTAHALEVTVFPIGDVNTDGNVDAADADKLLAYLSFDYDKNERLRPDVNKDGVVDNRDVVVLMQYLKGYNVVLCEDPNEGWTGEY